MAGSVREGRSVSDGNKFGGGDRAITSAAGSITAITPQCGQRLAYPRATCWSRGETAKQQGHTFSLTVMIELSCRKRPGAIGEYNAQHRIYRNNRKSPSQSRPSRPRIGPTTILGGASEVNQENAEMGPVTGEGECFARSSG